MKLSPTSMLLILALATCHMLVSAGTGGSSNATAVYYSVRPDNLRKCASPFCGGSFVKALNRRRTPCGDGTLAQECYVTGFDYSLLGLSDKDQVRFQEAVSGGTGIVSGSYAAYVSGAVTRRDKLYKLVVDGGWSAFEPSPSGPQCACGDNEYCVDDPSDDCFGCDCPTVCREKPNPICGGFAGIQCPSGLTCIDDPSDSCDPSCGGADCSGICVSLSKETCAASNKTDVGNTCSTRGFTCFDQAGDKCGIGCSKSCPGVCASKIGDFCGGFAGIPCGAGLECIDPLLDGCDNSCGGADCGGICVPVLK
jgi:hypothetical protein